MAGGGGPPQPPHLLQLAWAPKSKPLRYAAWARESGHREISDRRHPIISDLRHRYFAVEATGPDGTVDDVGKNQWPRPLSVMP